MTTYRYRRLLVLFTLVLSFSSSTVYGQALTITHEDILEQIQESVSVVYSETSSAEGLETLVNATGEDQTWDFSGLPFTETDTATIEIVQPPIPGFDDPAFEAANYVLRWEEADSSASVFATLTEDSLNYLGFGIVADADEEEGLDTVIVTNTPPLLQYALPFTYGSSWSDSTVQAFSLGEFVFESTLKESYTVDGWGTLITPQGSAPALRILNVSTSTTELIPGFPITAESRTIQFITEGLLDAAIYLDEEGNPFAASYNYALEGGPVATEPDYTIPNQMALEQNFPNPFNPSTSIPFTLEQGGDVSLKVYNVVGREVATLINGVRPAGKYTVTFDAPNLPGGVYFYRLELNGQMLIRSMTLLK